MTESKSIPPAGITSAPAPWLNLPVSVWMLPFHSSPPLLDHAYAPLEASSSFADQEKIGLFKGGLGTIQIIRYYDTPVGAYDEIMVIPGQFGVGKRKAKGKGEMGMLRITRIYVSQRDTAWNGRRNWNIPKHLAKFTFTTIGDGKMRLEVSPPAIEAMEGLKPFFSVELTAFKYLPAVPFSTNMAKWVGMDLRLAQPPVPSASSSLCSSEENDTVHLCGTTEWRVSMPEVWGSSKFCWVDMRSLPSDENGNNEWWPRYEPWKVGLFIEDGRINFCDGIEEGVGMWKGREKL